MRGLTEAIDGVGAVRAEAGSAVGSLGQVWHNTDPTVGRRIGRPPTCCLRSSATGRWTSRAGSTALELGSR
ncbi:hypothetical protein [Pseudactinotalea terrae]|uniref:hypothetical protein n=1 Tax=Pseudactinotalea terrae TaxID=1743262 RepID=UPI0012E0DAC6|nr:hypothetical protein [Pseudactinotalea terrae]